MPIFDQGYQHWDGKLSGHAWRWLAVARRGVKTQLKQLMTVGIKPVLLMFGETVFLALLVLGLMRLYP